MLPWRDRWNDMATGQQQEGKESPRYFFRSVSDRGVERHRFARIILGSLGGILVNSIDTSHFFPVTFLITASNSKGEKRMDRNDGRIVCDPRGSDPRSFPAEEN